MNKEAYDKIYEEMKAKLDRLDELEKQIGELEEGQHPDERKPRAETWLKERANWQSEVEALRNKVKEQELIIYGLEEGAEEWRQRCADLEHQNSILLQERNDPPKEKNASLPDNIHRY